MQDSASDHANRMAQYALARSTGFRTNRHSAYFKHVVLYICNVVYWAVGSVPFAFLYAVVNADFGGKYDTAERRWERSEGTISGAAEVGAKDLQTGGKYHADVSSSTYVLYPYQITVK